MNGETPIRRLLSHWLVVVSSHDPLPKRNTWQPMQGVARGSPRGPETVPESRVWVVVLIILKGVTHKTLKREGNTG